MWHIELKTTAPVLNEVQSEYIDCSRNQLIEEVIPLLYKHIKLLNKKNKNLLGSDDKYYYQITPIKSLDITQVESFYNAVITTTVEKYNAMVKSKNRIIKLSNKQCNRAIDEGTLEEIKLTDYVNPFKDNSVIVCDKECIYVK